MGAKMDRTKPRTPEDVERKFDLKAVAELKSQIKELVSQVETLSSEVETLKSYMESTQ